MAMSDFWRAAGKRIVGTLVFLSTITPLLVFVDSLLKIEASKSVIFSEAAPRGTHRLIPLPDGSTVDLNTDSRADVVFSDKQRSVTLESGEAVFEVKHDKNRPFIVAAGGISIQVVGTTFSVRMAAINPQTQEKAAQVAVFEGMVAITHSGSQLHEDPVYVGAGHAINLPDDIAHVSSLRTIGEPEAHRITAWQRGKIEVEGQALKTVIAELSRYNHLLIDSKDHDLLNVPITGSIKTDDPDSFLRDLHTLLCIQSKYVAPQHVVLSRIPGKRPGHQCR